MSEVKYGKLRIIASYTCNFISKSLQGGKSMVAFCSTVQIFQWFFCVASPDCEEIPKIEFVFQARRKEIKFHISY